MKNSFALLIIICMSHGLFAQGFDSTQIGKEYPYHLPILGGKAYKKGYKLPLPLGVMANYIYTKQNIILENFEMFVQNPGEASPLDEDFIDLSSIIQFGKSTVEVNTFNFRADAWILPFFSVGGYYGRFRSITNVALVKPVEVVANSEAEGKYWGFNLLAVAPLGPINVSADYSWSWTTNELLNKPVLVNVAGLRAIKNFEVKNKKDMFFGLWVGAQFQFLDAKTDGAVPLADVIDTDGSLQSDLDQWYNDLSDAEKALYGDELYNGLNDFVNATIHYRFDKRLEYNWNMVAGGQWQINRRVQFRAEAGFIRSKQQYMASLNYRFGMRRSWFQKKN